MQNDECRMQNESSDRISKRAEISLDAIAIANAKLDVVLGVKPGGGIEWIAFDENTADGIEGPQTLIGAELMNIIDDRTIQIA